MSIRIMGTGSYLPEKVMTNEDFEKIIGTSDEWITKRTGIKLSLIHISADAARTDRTAPPAAKTEAAEAARG